MQARERFIEMLRQIHYSHRGETKTHHKYRRGTHAVYVPKNSSLDDGWCRATLRQCGCNEDEIERFLAGPS
jgi:hypothetical protein